MLFDHLSGSKPSWHSSSFFDSRWWTTACPVRCFINGSCYLLSLIRFRVICCIGRGDDSEIMHRSSVRSHGQPFLTVKLRRFVVTIPYEDNQPSDRLLRIPFKTVRLRRWLESRLRLLALEQRIQDARALKSEFSLDWFSISKQYFLNLFGKVRCLWTFNDSFSFLKQISPCSMDSVNIVIQFI